MRRAGGASWRRELAEEDEHEEDEEYEHDKHDEHDEHDDGGAEPAALDAQVAAA